MHSWKMLREENMMHPYVLTTCSTADRTEAQFKERNVPYVCFHFTISDTEYMDDLGKSVPFDVFYQRMANGEMTKTSQVNTDEFVSFFTPFLEQGQDIIHLCLSAGISGVINSARVAKEILEEQFPERKIYIIDSYAASAGLGLLVDRLADLRDEGYSVDELAAWAIEHRLECNHWFFTTDLTYLIRGGRVSRTSGFIGNVLGICPLLNVNNEGKLIARKKIRGKSRVIREIVKTMEKHAEGGKEYSGKCFISNSACYEDARAVADLIEAAFPKLNGKVEITEIGTTIGSHTGPGTVAVFFWGDERTE